MSSQYYNLTGENLFIVKDTNPIFIDATKPVQEGV